MPNLVIKQVGDCGNSGEHRRINFTVGGQDQGTYALMKSDVEESVTDEDRLLYLRLTLKIYKVGRTWNQVDNALNSANGIQVPL